MRVAIVFMQFPAPSETFACQDVLELSRQGVDVACFSMRGSHPDQGKLSAERGLQDTSITHGGLRSNIIGLLLSIISPLDLARLVFFVAVRDYRRPRHVFKMFALIPQAFYLRRAIRKFSPDIVHLYWGHYPCLVAYLLRLSNPFTRLSMFLGAYDLEYELGVSKYMSRVASCIFTHSSYNVPVINDKFCGRACARVIYRGVDVRKLEGIVDPAPRSSLMLRVVSVGRLIAAKGHDRAIELVERLNAIDDIDATLDIVGAGPMEAAIGSLVESRGLEGVVRMYGHLAHADVLDLVARSDMLVLASSHAGERLPNSVKEAMFLECMVVTSATKGIEELVLDGETGLIVDFSQVDDVVSRVLSILSNDSARRRMVSLAKQKIENDFSLQRSARSYIKIWSDMMLI